MAKNIVLVCALALLIGIAICESGTTIMHVGGGSSTSSPSNTTSTVTTTTTTYEYTVTEGPKAGLILEKPGTEDTAAGGEGNAEAGSSEGPQPTAISSASSAAVALPTTRVVSAEVVERITTSSVSPAEIFSPNISTASNLAVNPSIRDDRIVYTVELTQPTISVFKTGASQQPVISLDTEQPVAISTEARTITINNEHIIDYGAVSSKVGQIVAPVEARIGTSSGPTPYALTIEPEATRVSFTDAGQEREQLTITSNIMLRNRNVYLEEGGREYPIGVSPADIFSGNSGGQSSQAYSSGRITNVSLGIEDRVPVYRVNATERFMLLWVMQMEIESGYAIDASSGEVLSQEKPWFVFLGGQ